MPRIKCPNCNSLNTCRIIYGLPDDKLEGEENAGRIYLGGCEVSFDDPDRHCNDCENDFYTKAPRSIDEISNVG